MADTSNKSTSKSSAARAKPAREAASSVRSSAYTPTASGNKATKRQMAAAKLQSKSERDDRRRNEQRILNIVDIIIKDDPVYRHKRRIWFALLGVGLVMTIATLILGQVTAQVPATQRPTLSTLTGISLILAYIFVIAAFVYDTWKIRPIRRAADERARSMSEKKREEMIARYEEERAQKRREKRQAKEASEE